MSIEMSPEQFRALGYRAVDLIAAQLAGVNEAPVRQPVPEALREALMAQPLPQEGVAT